MRQIPKIITQIPDIIIEIILLFVNILNKIAINRIPASIYINPPFVVKSVFVVTAYIVRQTTIAQVINPAQKTSLAGTIPHTIDTVYDSQNVNTNKRI